MKVLWDTLQSSTSLPLLFLQFRAPPFLFLSLFLFLHWSIISKLLMQGSSWWRSSFFLGLFPCGWCLLFPLLLCLPLHLHGGKSRLKDLIEAQRSSLHRSSTSKLPSTQSSTKATPKSTTKPPTAHPIPNTTLNTNLPNNLLYSYQFLYFINRGQVNCISFADPAKEET